MSERSKHPFVISPKPQKMAVNIFSFIPTFARTLVIKENAGLEITTSIKTKVKQITPPIKRIEEIEADMLSEKLMLFFVMAELVFLSLKPFIFLYNNPLMSEPIICEIKII